MNFVFVEIIIHEDLFKWDANRNLNVRKNDKMVFKISKF